MATLGQWVEGARPRTLPAALAPVVLGTAVAAFESPEVVSAARALLALVVALALQIGVNYSNDYSDGIRGTDTVRVGPVRLVGQELAAPTKVRAAAVTSFAVAAIAGLALVALTGAWWLLLVGVAAIASAWLYTGGPHPYGYAGLGEVFVFMFFGVVATMGSAFVQTGNLTLLAAVASAGVGALACAILVANNLRDIPGDTVVGKRTLAVRLGDAATRRLYAGLLVAAWVLVPVTAALSTPWALLGLVSVALGLKPARSTLSGVSGRDLIPVLIATGRLLLTYSVLMSVGLLVGAAVSSA